MSQQGNLKNKSTTGNGIETLTGDSGGAVGPDGSNNVNILSGVGISVVGNPGTNTLTISTTGLPPSWIQLLRAITTDRQR